VETFEEVVTVFVFVVKFSGVGVGFTGAARGRR
jgi:hypothetical protein